VQKGKEGATGEGTRYADRMPRIRLLAVTCVLAAGVLSIPAPASADATVFLGTNRTPSNRVVKGFAAGAGLLIAGFEFEYANSSEDPLSVAPRLRTYMVNGLAQTPFPIGRLQFYATAGGGIYRETLNLVAETNVGVNVGGGVKISLAGPLRLRLDYRVFSLKGAAIYPRPQRFYAGLNLKF
jgi:hypothetical protein